MELTNYVEDKRSRVVLYGDPFTGKTTLAAQLAMKYKLVWIDVEHGATSIVRNLDKQYHSNINLIQIPDSRTNPMAAETCLKIFSGAKCVICIEHGKVNCPICARVSDAKFNEVCLRELQNDQIVVLDSSTQLFSSIMAHVTRNEKDDYKMNFDDWGTVGRILDKIFSQIQGGNYNCVVIAHAQMVGVEKSDRITKLVPIGGSSNFNRTYAKYFDDVVYCELANGKHKFTSKTGASPQVITGSKNNIAIEDMAVPSLIPFFS